MPLAGKKDLLIVGGGTGAVLEELQGNQRITFVELSSKMIAKAKGRPCHVTVDFVHQDYLDWIPAHTYDAILLPFFLDSFDEDNLTRIINKSRSELSDQGELHVIDFQKGNAIQNFLVWLMYRFFRLTTNCDGRVLLDISRRIESQGFHSASELSYLHKWVFYTIYLPKKS